MRASKKKKKKKQPKVHQNRETPRNTVNQLFFFLDQFINKNPTQNANVINKRNVTTKNTVNPFFPLIFPPFSSFFFFFFCFCNFVLSLWIHHEDINVTKSVGTVKTQRTPEKELSRLLLEQHGQVIAITRVVHGGKWGRRCWVTKGEIQVQTLVAVAVIILVVKARPQESKILASLVIPGGWLLLPAALLLFNHASILHRGGISVAASPQGKTSKLHRQHVEPLLHNKILDLDHALLVDGSGHTVRETVGHFVCQNHQDDAAVFKAPALVLQVPSEFCPHGEGVLDAKQEWLYANYLSAIGVALRKLLKLGDKVITGRGEFPDYVDLQFTQHGEEVLNDRGGGDGDEGWCKRLEVDAVCCRLMEDWGWWIDDEVWRWSMEMKKKESSICEEGAIYARAIECRRHSK